jgi:aconitate hydratase 2/2-methylisocitrate dehydratase
LVAFGAATGVMPLDMPESVLVRFKGKMQPGITLRDLVHAIPLYAIKAGLLTVAKQGKKNIFSGRILEIEGLPNLKVEQAFELSDASAERSAAGLHRQAQQGTDQGVPQQQHHLMKNMIADGYADARTLARRIKGSLAGQPELLKPTRMPSTPPSSRSIWPTSRAGPVLPQRPGRCQDMLAEVAGTKIDEVFIGSCMTNIGHFRAASKLLEGKRDIPVKLWVAPPTKMDAKQLTKEGHYGVFGTPVHA